MTEIATPPLPLTERQRLVLDFITDFAGRHGYCASIREVMAAIGSVSTNGAMCHLMALKRKGYIAMEANTARSIRPIREVLNATA
jgi:SOS-response transcriptional repressor LexA